MKKKTNHSKENTMERVGFIGGSDCVKIMQGNWYDLWQVKTERQPPEDLSDNIAVQLGIHTEGFNVNWFEEHTGIEVTDRQLVLQKTIDGVPAKGAIDGKCEGKRIFEAKHTNAYNNMEKIISYYMPQIQLYCHLANAEGAYLSAIFGNSAWETSLVQYDESYFNSMWAVVSDFWNYVALDREPPLSVEIEQPSIDAIPVDEMVRRDASKDNAFIDAANTYIEHEAYSRVFEGAKKDLKAMVAPNEREVYCDILSIKRDKRGALRINTKGE